MAKRKQTPDILAEVPAPGFDLPGSHDNAPPASGGAQTVPPARQSTRKAGDPVAAIFPQERPRQSRSVRVKLTMPAAAGVLRAVKAYLTLALRALPDVVLVDEQADWELVVVGTPLPTRWGEMDSLVVSVVVLHPQGQQAEAGGRRSSDFRGVWLRSGAAGQVRPLCQDIVARFSANHLEVARVSL